MTERAISATSAASAEDAGNGKATAQAVLRQLQDPDTPLGEKLAAVLSAEVVAFSPEETADVCRVLWDFVTQYRDSNSADNLIAVASAIRKLVAYLPGEELGRLAQLLESGHRTPVPLEIELEVTKTIVRKLSMQPPVSGDPEPHLATCLLEVARTYLNPRLIAREMHGATALNAVLALLLLRSPHAEEVIELVQNTQADWFIQLSTRRAKRLMDDLKRRVPANAFPAVSRSLADFLARCAVDNV